MNHQTYIIKKPQEMISLGEKIIKNNSKFLIYGDLGAWKTHLVKGFVKWLNLNPNIVQSPTYTYINIYNNLILHIDMYRIDNLDTLLDKGILELINEGDYKYIFIERPKFEEEYIDNNWTKIDIVKINENTRKVTISKVT